MKSILVYEQALDFIKQRNARGVPIRVRRRRRGTKPLLLPNITLKVLDGADWKRASKIIIVCRPYNCIPRKLKGICKDIFELMSLIKQLDKR